MAQEGEALRLREHRLNVWHGTRRVRDVNTAYSDPLKPVFPADRLGPLDDLSKANCTTCHQGACKPFNGARMLAERPELNLIATTQPPPEPARR